MIPDDRPANEVVLTAEGVTRHYGDLAALADLTFDLRAGEILGLLGPNGAGKTTAIRVLTTILPPTRGQFSVMGIPDSQPEEIRARIGVVPESNGFPRDMDGAEFLTYMGRLYGLSKQSAADKAAGLLRQFGLERAARQRIATYSRGMKQRLAIARALVNDPRLLFLDEPTLGFDPQGQREMLRLIQATAAEEGTAVILSSHQLEVVEMIGHRVLILNHGRVIAEGSVNAIKRRFGAPRTWRLQTVAGEVPDALAVLASVDGVTARRPTGHDGQVIVSVEATSAPVTSNDVLLQLLQAGIAVEGFSQESVGLSDAFLAMIEEAQA